MKRTLLAWSGVILFVALLGTGYVYWQNSMSADKQNAAAKNKVTESNDVAITQPGSSVAAAASEQPGVFKDYQEGLVASTDGVTLLFFHAPWCPQCRMIESDINSQGVPIGVSILKVDYDSNQALRQKYGVTLQTTFVKVDKSGDEIQKYVAYNEPTFDSVKANLLER